MKSFKKIFLAILLSQISGGAGKECGELERKAPDGGCI